MTIKAKIFFGYGLAFTIMGLVVAWAIINILLLGKASNAILQENYRSILAAENMVNALELQNSAILLIFLEDKNKGSSQFRENEVEFLQWFVRAKDNITIVGESELIESIENDYLEYRKQFSKLMELGKDDSLSYVKTKYLESIFPIFSKLRNTCNELQYLNEKAMRLASENASYVAKRATWSTLLIATISLFIVFALSFILVERIVHPIECFIKASREIAAGEYSILIPVESNDELGKLAKEFNQMAIQLNHYHKMNIEKIISEKKTSEAILSSIDDGLIVLDTNLQVMSINPAARRILRLEFQETSKMCCADILPAPNICALIKQTIETGSLPKTKEEERIISFNNDDKHQHYLFSITTIQGKQNLFGIVLSLRDVTRLKEVERLKSEFVMAASHELRTPLTSIGMSIDLLLEHAIGRLFAKDQELLQVAHEEVQRLKILVNDLLELAKMEAGQIELEFSEVDVKSLVEHIQSIFKNQIEMKSIIFTTQLPENLPPIWADANKLAWVLSNLISNALRYVKQGGNITIAAQKAGTHVHISVNDNGPGIPLEYQSKIFQKFIQIKGKESGGTGLGLAICKEIIRAHSGAIWVDSEFGKGSVFTFTVPIAR